MRKMVVAIMPFLFIACNQEREKESIASGVDAYVPVYVQPDTIHSISIKSSDPSPTLKAGKIYAYGNYIFQNDINKGIHVILNASGQQPKKIGFISIPYNTEMAIRGKYIYANSINNLVVIDMSDPLNPVLVKTMKNAFPLINQKYPPLAGYFICPDPSKGIVVDWELKSNQTAPCRR
jgi:hypothetical protein